MSNQFSHFNLLKSNWVSINQDDARIINSDARLAARNEGKDGQHQDVFQGGWPGDEDGFIGGLHAEEMEGLVNDPDEGVIKAKDAGADEELRQELLKQAEDELALAQTQINQMKEDARSDIEVMKRVAAEEARAAGYAEGFEKGIGEINKLRDNLKEERKKLQMEYDRRVDELEPKFVDLLTGIYEQIFNVELKEYGPIVTHLISNTLRKGNDSRDFIVHVSKADYEYVNGQKEEIRSYAASGKATVEMIEDITLLPGDCMIETDGGIFDCGLGVQLAGLNEKLRLLSYEK